MTTTIKLTKSDVRRALVRHHFSPCASQMAAFDRLRSIQFDPLAPVGCNHDLVLQARVPEYKVGDWQTTAYNDRCIYDGWDKMASLVPMDGWPVRRYIHTVHRRMFEKKIFEDHKEAVELVLDEITDRGPLMPKQFDFQQKREEWKGSWFGPSVTKQILRALWHSGQLMTSGRKGGQHIYDLTERVVPQQFLNAPLWEPVDAIRELVLERHRAMGILRPASQSEIWSGSVLAKSKRPAIAELVSRGEIVAVDVEGMQAHATPEFLGILDQPALEPKVVFVAPLDQFMWDRKMIAHLFDFEYTWEVYVPEPKRKWGYYVLPVLFGNSLVARVEFYCRGGVLEIRKWRFEPGDQSKAFFRALEKSLKDFMIYCSASQLVVVDDIDSRVRVIASKINSVAPNR